MSKETILKEFKTFYCLSSIMDVESQNEIKKFLIKAIDQTRQETIVEIKEKLNKVIKYNSEISEDYQYAYSDLVEEINKLKK